LIAPPANTNDVQAGGVLEGIGEEIPGGDPAQPLDILALQETTGNTMTVAPIVNGLNTFYNTSGRTRSGSIGCWRRNSEGRLNREGPVAYEKSFLYVLL
jgi:hypothetical protein